ncbi:hypothetical protein [uncultured Brevundimonas sp.]|uniref:hypothetical protein n=1 Tax=uncultured Brevundimonas sp. TaxID=213418 RepID=UPI0025E6D476|nr:hypothetical protein [uncultured Brevundimonas sp.]
MANHECGALADLFEAKKANDGLLDVKFYLVDTEEASYEQVCEEVQNLYAALDRSTPLTFGDTRAA